MTSKDTKSYILASDPISVQSADADLLAVMLLRVITRVKVVVQVVGPAWEATHPKMSMVMPQVLVPKRLWMV
jgi:hypothetical protein